MSILKYVCPLKQKPDLLDPSSPLSKKVPATRKFAKEITVTIISLYSCNLEWHFIENMYIASRNLQITCAEEQAIHAA